MTKRTDRKLRRVLLVDDSDIMLSVVRRHLTLAGLVVIDVQGPDEALWITRGVFDVAVLDIDLGETAMNGVQLAIELLGQDRVRHAIFLSATTDPALLAAAQRIGTVIDKGSPEPIAVLLAAIARVLDEEL